MHGCTIGLALDLLFQVNLFSKRTAIRCEAQGVHETFVLFFSLIDARNS